MVIKQSASWVHTLTPFTPQVLISDQYVGVINSAHIFTAPNGHILEGLTTNTKASELEIYAQRVEEWETKYQAELQVGFKDQPVQLQHHDRHTVLLSTNVYKTFYKSLWPLA